LSEQSPATVVNLVFGAVGAACRNLLPTWRGAWASLALAGVATGLWWAARGAPLAGLWAAIMFLTGLMAKGAAWRLAVQAGKPGPGGLQLGRVELNLILVGLLTVAFLIILGLLFLVVLLCTAYAVASAGPGFVASDVMTWAGAIIGRGRFVFGLVFAAGAAGMIWAAARICLATPITVASGKVQVLATWPLTRDRTVPILISGLITSVAPFGAIALISMGSGILIDLARGMVLVGLWLPLAVGLMAYWRQRLS